MEFTTAAANYNHALVAEVLADLDASNGGGEIFFKGGGYFREGFVSSARTMLLGETWNAPVHFRPTVPGTKFFLAQRRRFNSNGDLIPNPATNSELQLETTGMKDLVLLGDRSTRCHGFELRGVDHAVIENVHTFGIAGTALNLQHVREYQLRGYYGRYNAYCDPNNPAIMDPAFIWGGSAVVGGENSNLSTFHGMQEAFAFGVPWLIDGAFKNSIAGGLVHHLAVVNLSLEDIIIKLFGGARGWDAAGLPRNQLAALMHGGPNVANVTGRRMLRGFAACSPIEVRGGTTNLQLDQVNIVGSSGMHLMRVQGSSNVQFGQGTAYSAASARFSVTADQATSIFTITGILAGLLAQCPETGTPCEIASAATSALPIVDGQKLYMIRLSDTTFQLAATAALAEAGTAIALTAAGSGLEIYCGGQLFYATGNSEITIDPQAMFNDGYRIAQADETSLVSTVKVAGTTFTAGPGLPSVSGEQLLFAGENISLNTALTDYTLKKTFRGSRFIPTRVQVIRRSGGATTVSGNLQIYTAAAAGGTALLAAAQSLAGLDTRHKVLEVDTNSASGVRTGTAATPLYAQISAASGQAYFRFDVRVYGRVVD